MNDVIRDEASPTIAPEDLRPISEVKLAEIGNTIGAVVIESNPAVMYFQNLWSSIEFEGGLPYLHQKIIDGNRKVIGDQVIPLADSVVIVDPGKKEYEGQVMFVFPIIHHLGRKDDMSEAQTKWITISRREGIMCCNRANYWGCVDPRIEKAAILAEELREHRKRN